MLIFINVDVDSCCYDSCQCWFNVVVIELHYSDKDKLFFF